MTVTDHFCEVGSAVDRDYQLCDAAKSAHPCSPRRAAARLHRGAGCSA
jgi:hypothetical protein